VPQCEILKEEESKEGSEEEVKMYERERKRGGLESSLSIYV
jgi:hypothetical protein